MDKKPERSTLEPVSARKDSPLAQFSEKIGKVEILEKDTGSKSFPTRGFYCITCKVSFTSSDAYLDHCNGRVHQKNLGISLKVERVEAVDRVKARIEMLSKKHSETKSVEKETAVSIKEQRKERKKLKKSENRTAEEKNVSEELQNEETSNEDDLLANVMGFKSFS